MANQYQHLLTAIDVGSAKTCALAAEITDSGLRYRGHGVAESRGSRKGVIVELDKAVGAIQKAVEQAEDIDRKSTRLNSSHGYISYAVFCLKKKKKTQHPPVDP